MSVAHNNTRFTRTGIDITGVTITQANSIIKLVFGGVTSELEIKAPYELQINEDNTRCWLFCEKVELQGTYTSLIRSAIAGLKEKFKVSVKIKGSGYKASLVNGKLSLWIGYSHNIDVMIPAGIDARLGDIKQRSDKKGTESILYLASTNKQILGSFASTLTGFRPHNVYHAQGITRSDRTERNKESSKRK